MRKGDVVLISFPFTDLKGVKKRPALVLFVSDLFVVVSFITTQFKWKKEYDLILEPNENNGLKKTSLLRISKIASVDKDLILGKLGELGLIDIFKINKKLTEILDL
jgi:mRNA interferase MazF